MSLFSPLDVLRCPLEGINLIEASAGTGKTWTICGLYLRLLLEQERTVNQILVVTFTTSATAELRERIRNRIVQTLRFLQGEPSRDGEGDPFIGALTRRLDGELMLDRSGVIKRLELARETFDEAAIYTIHGFCQRALAETPFSAGLPFEVELVRDDGLLIQQAANDFWRCHIANAASDGGGSPTMTGDLAGYLAGAGDTPEKYARLLRKVLGKPLSTRKWPTAMDAPPAPPDTRAVANAFANARGIWAQEADAIHELLRDSIDRLKGKYTLASIALGKDAWTAWFDAGVSLNQACFGPEHPAQLYRQSRLKLNERKNCTAPGHPFFDAAEDLFQAGEDFLQGLQLTRHRLLRRLVEEVPAELRRKKRQQRVVAFDDMLFNLHQALTAGEFPWLAGSLRARYPVALIDEFQDTDPLQLDIFRTLYPPDASWFMVGDPKQAIYSFRNADLPTYLSAQKLATGRYTLGENQRSVEGLIAGCNALFGANSRAFLLDGVGYRSVSKGRKPLPDLNDGSGEPRSPMQVWLLADGEGQWPTRADAFDRAGATTAGEIARLLGEGRKGRVTIGDTSLRASDIAVLVRSHAHGRRMRLALAAVGVGSVELSQASVFETQEADELERILVAVMEPGSERLIRAALATEILGCDAAALEALGYHEALFFDRMQRFADYRVLWEQRGFATMFRKLLREEGAEARLLNLERGERRLTNVLQLAELLAERAREHSSPDVLLRWLGNRRRQPGVDDAAQQRLESDRNLVHIVTIHKSKGLEYPIVFCPFLWDGYRTTRSDTPDLLEYHEPDGTAVLDFRPIREEGEEAAIKALRRDEQAAETLRQIYVAVTRAVQRCYLIAGCYKRAAKDRNCSTESTRSMLNWLVCGEGFDAGQWFESKLEPAAIDAAWNALGTGCADPFAVAPLPELSHQPALAAGPVAECLSARPVPAPAAPSWNRSSFSGLVRNLTHDAAVADHDTAADVAIAPLSEPGEGPAADDILAFPRGPAAGECIHHLLEHIDFTDPVGWGDAIGAALEAYPQEGGLPDTADTLQRQLRRMLDGVLATELGQGVRLGRIGRSERLTELGFTLPARALQPESLNAFLTTHGYAAGRLDFQTVSGYLSGAIDLVFRSGGRYFLLDWKSNHLGDTREDYALERLDHAMTEHAYRLQYLLYSVALHRLLRLRIAQYDYDRHFGGVYYLFVRGVRPDWATARGPTGVFYDRPEAAMLRALDALIDGVDPGTSA